MNVNSTADVEPLVSKAFQELGVRWPLSEVTAKLIITRQIAREVIAGQRDLLRAASDIKVWLWRWLPTTSDLEFLLVLNDEPSWNDEYQRYIPAIANDQLETFVRLACLTDEQIASESQRSASTMK
ncbi:hypothetical protein ACFPT7_14970 [Acidicapsa dinghuensis]|uniref:XRE family transcriptional regulator n=1 Tax=Acidicapsa dinghuensis TaxID=2218256 RepID=A0ABW1EJY9_9BACT|nr:hypothetical protein [Acidicapsa dinghuensis]